MKLKTLLHLSLSTHEPVIVKLCLLWKYQQSILFVQESHAAKCLPAPLLRPQLLVGAMPLLCTQALILRKLPCAFSCSSSMVLLQLSPRYSGTPRAYRKALLAAGESGTWLPISSGGGSSGGIMGTFPIGKAMLCRSLGLGRADLKNFKKTEGLSRHRGIYGILKHKPSTLQS